MKKFVTAIIISFVVTVSSAGIKVAAFSSSNLGAAFVLSNVMSDEKNDKNGSCITVIDGNREDIKFSFKIAEIINSAIEFVEITVANSF